MRTGAASAASAVGTRRHNENDVTMTIAGLWRYGDWRHVATGCTALVMINSTTSNAEGQMKVTLIGGGDVELIDVTRVIVQRRRQTDISRVSRDDYRQISRSTRGVDEGRPIHRVTGLAVSTTWITRMNLQHRLID